MKNNNIENNWLPLPAPAGVIPTHYMVGADKVPASADPQLLQDATHYCVDYVEATRPAYIGAEAMPDIVGLPQVLPHGGHSAKEQAFWASLGVEV